MDKFLTCLCEEEFQVLLIDGNVSDQELQEAWLIILSEYYDLRGDVVGDSEQRRLTRDIVKIQNHLYLLGQCVEFLSKAWSDSIAESVNKLGYPFRPVSKDPKDYHNLLNIIINRSKTKYIHLQQYLKQLEEIISKLKNEKPSREYFEQTLIELEEMQGANYKMEELTVYKFVMLEKKLLRKVELLKAQVAKNGNGTY